MNRPTLSTGISAVVVGVVVAITVGCGSRIYDLQSGPSPAALTWTNDSFTITTTFLTTSTAQVYLTTTKPIIRLVPTISSNLTSYISVPPQISNLTSGLIQIPMIVPAQSTSSPYFMAGTLTVDADGVTSIVNIYLNIWERRDLTGMGISVVMPPNLIENNDGSLLNLSEPGNSPAFTVEQLANTQNLSAHDFVVQETIPSLPGDAPAQSLYDQATKVTPLSAGGGIYEITIFYGIGDYQASDVAYVRINGAIDIITNNSLSDDDFLQVVQSAQI